MTKLVDTDDLLDGPDMDSHLYTTKFNNNSRWTVMPSMSEEDEENTYEMATYKVNNEEESVEDEEGWMPSSSLEHILSSRVNTQHDDDDEDDELFPKKSVLYDKNVTEDEYDDDDGDVSKVSLRSVTNEDDDDNDEDHFGEPHAEISSSEEADEFDTDALLASRNDTTFDQEEEIIAVSRPAKRLKRVKVIELKERTRNIMGTVPKLTRIVENVAQQEPAFNMGTYLCSYN